MGSIHLSRQLTSMFLAVLLAFGAVGAISDVAAQETPGADATMSKVEVVDQVSPAVVTVYNLATPPGLPSGGEAVAQGAGTGFIIDEEGHIVTNWHVVDGGDAFAVVLADGTQVEAELIGTDPRDDLAVVKIDPAAVPATVPFGDSTELQPGQEVLAIGSPLGALTNSVTSGIVSALGRNQLYQGNPQCQSYSNLIQHDASINQGNSGGPLFNMQGEVIGVNTLGLAASNSGVPVQGIFFAVPSSTVIDAVEQMIETGTVSQPYIGIVYFTNDPAVANQYDLAIDSGILISQVEPGSPADDAGLEPGDVVSAVNGQEITQTTALANIIIQLQPGETVTLTVYRGEEQMEVELTLGEAPLNAEECGIQGGGMP